ncbi:MAG: hypothetical protein MHMPM18_002287 [Marteilia pararefringens]
MPASDLAKHMSSVHAGQPGAPPSSPTTTTTTIIIPQHSTTLPSSPSAPGSTRSSGSSNNKRSICMQLQRCRICWRSIGTKLAFQCKNCGFVMHMKCDTSDLNLVRPGQGLMVNVDKVPQGKSHNNWCHFCQRITNKLDHLIIDQMMFCGNKTLLKHILIIMISFIRTSGEFTGPCVERVISAIYECVLDDQVQVIDQMIGILDDVIDEALYELHHSDVAQLYEKKYNSRVAESQARAADETLPQPVSRNRSTLAAHGAYNTATLVTGLGTVFDRALNQLRMLNRLVHRELNDIERCWSCYEITKSKSPDQQLSSEICEFPHYLVWYKPTNMPMKPVKLIWISSTNAFIQKFCDKRFLTVSLDDLFEFSEYYRTEYDKHWSFNVIHENFLDILENDYDDVPLLIRKYKDDLNQAFIGMKQYLDRVNEKFSTKKDLNTPIFDKFTFNRYPNPIDVSNWEKYSPFYLANSKHLQFPQYDIKYKPSNASIDLKLYRICSVETFSLRCKLETPIKFDILDSPQDQSADSPHLVTRSKPKQPTISSTMFDPKSSAADASFVAESFDQNSMSNGSHLMSSDVPNAASSQNVLPDEVKNKRRSRRSDASRTPQRGETSKAKIYKHEELQIGQRSVSNASAIPSIADCLDNENTGQRIEVVEDLLPTADLITKLHQNLMNSISNQVGTFCLEVMKSINHLSQSYTPKATLLKGLLHDDKASQTLPELDPEILLNPVIPSNEDPSVPGEVSKNKASSDNYNRQTNRFNSP